MSWIGETIGMGEEMEMLPIEVNVFLVGDEVWRIEAE